VLCSGPALGMGECRLEAVLQGKKPKDAIEQAYYRNRARAVVTSYFKVTHMTIDKHTTKKDVASEPNTYS